MPHVRVYSINGEDSATFVFGGIKAGDIERIKEAIKTAMPTTTFDASQIIEGLQPLDKNLFDGHAEKASIAFAPDMPIDIAVDGEVSNIEDTEEAYFASLAESTISDTAEKDTESIAEPLNNPCELPNEEKENSDTLNESIPDSSSVDIKPDINENQKIYIMPVKGAVSSPSAIPKMIKDFINYCKDSNINLQEETIGGRKKFFVVSTDDANKLTEAGYQRV